MRRWLPLLTLMLALPTAAHAQFEIRKMGWGDSGLYDHDSSPLCSALPDQSKLVVSFEAPPGVQSLTRVWGYVDFCTKPYAIPSWWTFAPFGGCRAESLSVVANFSNGPFSHPDPWGGRGVVTFSYEPHPSGDWAMSRIWVEVTTSPGSPIPLVAGEESYAFQIVFGNPDACCQGCDLPACFVLNGLVIEHDGDAFYTQMDGYQNYATWQGGQGDCPFVVPTERTTWGRLKESYR